MDVGNRKDMQAAEKAAKIRAQEDRETITAICSTPASRRWLWELLETAGVFRTSFTADPCSTAFNEGNRNSGLRLLSQITDACPEQFVTMMRESNERSRRHSDSAESSAGRSESDSGAVTDPDDDSAGYDPDHVD